jgi:nicotinate-nucleotide pyrophosphorylase (carboxylating)
MVMIKDNHILACGGIVYALMKADQIPRNMKIEIEVTNIEDGVIAAKMGADIIMADHMTPSDTKEMREQVRAVRKDTLIEASGNVTKKNVADYAGCADIVSLGSLTHSAKAVHFSMDVDIKN